MERTYLKVEWKHDIEGEPVLLFSELDGDRMELRKIEVYRDGRADRADFQGRSGSTKLSIEPLPSIGDIASDPQFIPESITREEFESLWVQGNSHT